MFLHDKRLQDYRRQSSYSLVSFITYVFNKRTSHLWLLIITFIIMQKSRPFFWLSTYAYFIFQDVCKLMVC